nr:prepilin-type N-terminal cleavage/methylation domain-containing protein [Weissella diestrammenae]
MKRAGFTLIETMVVLILVSVMSGSILLFSVNQSGQNWYRFSQDLRLEVDRLRWCGRPQKIYCRHNSIEAYLRSTDGLTRIQLPTGWVSIRGQISITHQGWVSPGTMVFRHSKTNEYKKIIFSFGWGEFRID